MLASRASGSLSVGRMLGWLLTSVAEFVVLAGSPEDMQYMQFKPRPRNLIDLALQAHSDRSGAALCLLACLAWMLSAAKTAKTRRGGKIIKGMDTFTGLAEAAWYDAAGDWSTVESYLESWSGRQADRFSRCNSGLLLTHVPYSRRAVLANISFLIFLILRSPAFACT